MTRTARTQRLSSASLDNGARISVFSQEKRKKILKAAIKLFLSEGYLATSMNRVAEVAGVTKQTIYSHFQDKEGLFTAIIENVTLRHLNQQLDGEHLSGEPETVLRGVARAFLELQKDPQYLNLLRTIIAESERFPELARLYVRTVIQRGMRVMTAYLESRPELRIEDPVATARIFCGSIIACVISQEILHGKDVIPFKTERLVDSLIACILRK